MRWLHPVNIDFSKPYESELDPVDDDCPENEEEVDENPKCQGCKSL